MEDFRHRSQDTGAPRPNGANITGALEAIDNLTYLALHEAEKPESVRFYLKQARERPRVDNRSGEAGLTKQDLTNELAEL
jgi:hypothetical protein